MSVVSTSPHSLSRRRLLLLSASASGGDEDAAACQPVTPVAAQPMAPAPVQGMKVLRTPEARFDGLADDPFMPQYVEIDAGDAAGGVL